MAGRWVPMAFGMVVGVVVIGALEWWLRPADVREPARRFMEAVAAGRIEQAVDEVDTTFRREVQHEELRAFLERHGIGPASRARWDGHCVHGESGEVFAQVAREGNGPVAVKLDLVSEEGAWRVASVHVRPTSAVGATRRFGPPPAAEMLALIRTTTRRFADAVAARDLTLFLGTTARAFRERFSAREFERAFGGFIEQEINLAALERFDPVFDAPSAISASGVLTLEGYFPTRPSRVRFRYEYAYRHIGWQLVGIDLAVRPASG